MTEILLIRHGETDWNAERRLQGFLDVSLNAKGRRQAEALAQSLLSEQLDAVVSSDLARARDTAEPIARAQGLAVVCDAGLRERCYGGFEGMLYAEIGERYPDAYADWKARKVDARFPPGVNVAETLREFSRRAISTLSRIASQARGQKIAVVTHGGVLECANLAARGLALEQERDFPIFNASVSRFTWDGAALRLASWGEVEHLRQEALLDEIRR